MGPQKRVHGSSSFLGSKHLRISPEKTIALAFTRKRMADYPFLLEGHPVSYGASHEFLGGTIDCNLTWTPEIKSIRQRICVVTQVLRPVARARSPGMSITLLNLAHSTIIFLSFMT